MVAEIFLPTQILEKNKQHGQWKYNRRKKPEPLVFAKKFNRSVIIFIRHQTIYNLLHSEAFEKKSDHKIRVQDQQKYKNMILSVDGHKIECQQ